MDNWIPNIVLGQDYDKRYADSLIHYDEQTNLANFFGNEMPVHRHAQFAQLHFFKQGPISFHIDDELYRVTGPVCFFTPAATPHSFRVEANTGGHVLTIHQSIIWKLLKEGLGREISTELSKPSCITTEHLSTAQLTEWRQLEQALEAIHLEWLESRYGKSLALESWIRITLILISRLSSRRNEGNQISNDELYLFNRFSDLIEQHFKAHWALPQYTAELGISENKLHQLCQNISGKPPKRLIQDRTIQEAKLLLTMTEQSIREICFGLGFSDPAYFSRYFKRLTGTTAKRYRESSIS
ncbi:MAG: 4-hydroxyphenylacetate catabolism regulatory protein HpaA [Oceanospirillaceae bacterium]|nr:4-hydroxyphenylacetate catabolism regulatory protein HpaA [Oceanospirillaceae bacterium]